LKNPVKDDFLISFSNFKGTFRVERKRSLLKERKGIFEGNLEIEIERDRNRD
jgi:hypothetical protein